jgi:hypothetical protein
MKLGKVGVGWGLLPVQFRPLPVSLPVHGAHVEGSASKFVQFVTQPPLLIAHSSISVKRR